VVSEQILLDAIRPPTTSPSSLDAQWTIVAAKPLPPPALEHCFGTRLASAVPVKLKESSDSDACWIESLEEGWLFLTPGWLLAVGGTPDKLLGKSRIVSAQIADCGLALSQFPAYPRISAPLCASDWLACGTAALAFDPICGDGTAHAIREAILASAVIRALAAGGACDDLLAHYEARLTAGFERHLTLCRQFYASGGTGAGTGNFWRSELEALDRGIQWCHAALANRPGFRYQLRGFELEAVR
jgi:hypothetical protein